jgi:hypothetical protein
MVITPVAVSIWSRLASRAMGNIQKLLSKQDRSFTPPTGINAEFYHFGFKKILRSFVVLTRHTPDKIGLTGDRSLLRSQENERVFQPILQLLGILL